MPNRRLFWVIAISTCLLPFVFMAAVHARIYPPCQGVTYTVDGPAKVSYSVTDPLSGYPRAESYEVALKDERAVTSVLLDQGILSWIVSYRNSGDPAYTYEVHYRIFDPGRGTWKAGVWGPYAGYETSVEQHTVKDGVIAWKAHRRLGASTSDMMEHQVLYVTYDPEFGTWPIGNRLWQVDTKESPEVLRVKNGVVAWPVNNPSSGVVSDQNHFSIEMVLFDYEIKRWVYQREWFAYAPVLGFCYPGFDWIQVVDDTAQIQVHMSGNICQENWFLTYNPANHIWELYEDQGKPYRRAFFLPGVKAGIVPFWVWFWDCSIGMEPPDSTFSWVIVQGSPPITTTERSFGYLYKTPGSYTATESVIYKGLAPSVATATIVAQAPMPPTGGILINNGATYTTSIHVTLSLSSTGATQMCFRQNPGWAFWTSWEPIASGKSWILSLLYAADGSPDGPHYVSVKFRDQFGTESPVYQASIILDSLPPVGALSLNNGSAMTGSSTVQTSWSASDACGVTMMSYTAYNEEDTFFRWSTWTNYQPTSINIPFSTNPGRKTVMVRFKDAGGNITQIENSITLSGPSTGTILSLNNHRFSVSVEWKNYNNGTNGYGQAVPLTNETGYFWFFNPENVELVIKVLDGRSINGSFWVLYGSLTDLEFAMAVTDTVTGRAKTFLNPPHKMASVSDTISFPAAMSSLSEMGIPSVLSLAGFNGSESTTGSTLKLNGNRYAITVNWRNYNDGSTGSGQAVNLSDQTGYFWFFNSGNVELVVKVLDGRAINGSFWVLYGSLTDVEFTMTVTDTTTGLTKNYYNPPRQKASVSDTNSFPAP